MLRKCIAGFVCILFLGSIAVNALEVMNFNTTPSLSFSGTTANCEVTINQRGKQISVTLQLWQGNQLVGSWSKNGTSSVMISESCTVTRGSVYQLKVSGRVGNNAISGSTTGTCP